MDSLRSVIQSVYKEVLNRDPDLKAYSIYTKCLREGKSRDWLVNILKESEEYKNRRKPPKQEEIYKVIHRKSRTAVSEEVLPEEPVKQEEPDEPQKSIINIFMCVRDNEEDISITFQKLKKIERQMPEYDFYYYILENDSKDDTPHLVIDFFSYSKGKFRIEKSDKKKWECEPDRQRVHDMAYYRNMMLDLCNTWEGSTYSFVVDTEITFHESIISEMIDLSKNNPDFTMITPYGTVQHEKRYYDTFAFHGINMPPGKFPYSNPDKIIEVLSAFAGFVMILSENLRKCKWGVSEKNVSEHNYLCEQLRQYGKIVCTKTILVNWKVGKEL